MVYLHLFYWPLEQVFLFLRPSAHRRFIALLVSFALLAEGFIASSVFPPKPAPSIPVTALACTPLFFHPFPGAHPQNILEKLSEWILGDRSLKFLRARYRRTLMKSFIMMAGDSCATLAVPFIGQALYDTALRGAHFPGSLRTMTVVSWLLIVIEGLDPFRRYIQYRLTQTTSGFVADVRFHLLDRSTHGSEPGIGPALIYLHAPSLAVRNIEFPLKMPWIGNIPFTARLKQLLRIAMRLQFIMKPFPVTWDR